MEANTGREFENSAEHVGEKLHILYDERKYCVKVWCNSVLVDMLDSVAIWLYTQNWHRYKKDKCEIRIFSYYIYIWALVKFSDIIENTFLAIQC